MTFDDLPLHAQFRHEDFPDYIFRKICGNAADSEHTDAVLLFDTTEEVTPLTATETSA